jgi:hypothetical protein
VSTPELEALLEQAIEHVNAGELEQGRTLLERVLEQDPKNDRAWVWLSGCVEEPMQRRICLQQALSVNPNNQAALDGMDALDGKLVQASEVPPSLLESRLSAIGMGDRPPTARPAPAVSRSPSPEAAAIAPIAPLPTDIAWEQETDETSERPGRRRRIVLLVAVVLLLFLVVCILVAATVVPPLLKGL